MVACLISFLKGTPPGIASFESGSHLQAKLSVKNKILSELNIKIDYETFDPTKF